MKLSNCIANSICGVDPAFARQPFRGAEQFGEQARSGQRRRQPTTGAAHRHQLRQQGPVSYATRNRRRLFAEDH